MTEEKSPGAKETPKVSDGHRVSRSTERSPDKAGGSVRVAEASKTTRRQTSRKSPDADSSFLGVDDFKHFREVFKKKGVLEREIIEDETLVPPLPLESGPEQTAIPPKSKRRGRGPQKAPTKVLTSIRLDKHVYEYYKSSGRGWQSRINDMLTAQMQKEIRNQKRRERAAAKSAPEASKTEA